MKNLFVLLVFASMAAESFSAQVVCTAWVGGRAVVVPCVKKVPAKPVMTPSAYWTAYARGVKR